MAGARRSNRLPQRHPLSDELYNVRIALREDQTTFAKRFGVSRTTLVGWERYRPPMHAGVKQWIALELAKIKRLATNRKRKKEQREATERS